MSRNYSILLTNILFKTIIPTYIFPRLTSTLDNSVIFSTPINSYKSLKEGWFLLTKLNINPYDALINHPPLLLQLLSLIDMDNDLIVNFIFAVLDTLVLQNVIKLSYKCSSTPSNNNNAKHLIWFYLLNPLIILSCFSKNSIVLTNLFLTLSINNLIDELFNLALVQLSIASYLSYFPIYLIIPFLNHIYHTKKAGLPWKNIIIFILATIILSLNNLNFDMHKVIDNCYLSIIKFEKIQPNIGLWWYFFIEIFEFFHDFYIVVFNMYSFVFIIPFTYRLGKNSIFNILICILWINFTKNYPTIGDLNLSTVLILTIGYNHLQRLRLPLLLSSIILIVVLVLLVLFYYLWVNLSSGNSNFFYGVGLVYSMLIAWTMCDLIWSELQNDWYQTHDNIDESKVKLTQF